MHLHTGLHNHRIAQLYSGDAFSRVRLSWQPVLLTTPSGLLI
ncbi:hypothetical protein RESH_05456 [Rhodopirellula europaea SH398]|uniref:Uncharacterized protein n=1 Tax=Rhodopirellula europaea SH398 TaxID=1263868 RepID=M5RX95_9BACT|nr:hypothetical protein RESH_05456 [Rhodopirellula europaea SH398]